MDFRKSIRDSLGFAFSQYIVRSILMLRGLLAAKLLGPGMYGGWNALQIMMDYGALSPGGTQQGLDQMVPRAIASADGDALLRVKRSALFNILVTTLLYALACLTWAGFGSSRMREAWGFLGIGVALLCVALTNLSNWQTSILRSHGDITTISGWTVLQGAIGGILGLALIPTLGAWGLLAGWAFGCAVAFTYSTVRSRRQAVFAPSLHPESLDLVQVGFPMYAYMASSLAMRNLDRLIILRFLGVESLGFYSLSVFLLTLLMYLPDSITYVMYPQLVRAYGESGHSPASIEPRVVRILRAMAVALPALSAVAFLSAHPVVTALLPKFLPGIGAMKLLAFGAVALGFCGFASVVLMAVGRQALLLPAALLGVGFYAAFDVAAVKGGFGINGVATGTVAAYVVNATILLAMAFSGLAWSGRQILGELGRLLLPLPLAVGIAMGIDFIIPTVPEYDLAGRALRLLVKLASFALLYGAAVAPMVRGLGLVPMLAELQVPVLGPLARMWLRRHDRRAP